MSIRTQNTFKIIMLVYCSFSNPLYNLNKYLFFLVTLISLLILLYFINKLDLSKKSHNLYSIVEELCGKFVYVIIWLGIFLILAYFIEDTTFNDSIPIVVGFCWMIALMLIYYVLSSLYFIIIKTKEIIDNTIKHKYIMIILFGIIIFSVFILPDIVFGFIYNLFFVVFGNSNLSFLESFHLSMLIGNTLPVGEVSIKYITIIESNQYIYSVQLVHVILNKIINLFVVGIVLNYLLAIINTKDNV